MARIATRVFPALALASVTLVANCSRPAPVPAQPATAAPAATTDNPALTALAREDQANQMGQETGRRDQDRIVLVLAEVGAGRVHTPADRFNAAIVLQHSPMTIRNDSLVAISPDNYLLAHHLAVAAFEGGHAPARELVAQSIDRYLSVTTGRQKYGTNRFINQKTGAEELAPIDRSTTDAERARYGIPPLADLLKRWPEAKGGQ